MSLIRRKISLVLLPITLLLLLAVTAMPVSAECSECCECGCGCTLTQGYWKNHSAYGPAPYEAAWSGQEDLPFWNSGMTIYQVLWEKAKGNPYYILAHQYIAANLNIQNGASAPPEVAAAMNWSYTFFQTAAPGDDFSKALREEMLYTKDILDRYNNGQIGPGHCPN